MIYFRDTLDFRVEENTVLTIGKFDGLHMGHKRLLEEVDKKKKEGLKSAIFTFDISPQNSIYHTNNRVLTTNDEKHLVFENVGIDYFVECPFTDYVRNLEAEEFIYMMVDRLKVKCFVVGTDCGFGHNRSGNCKVLEKYADEYGYEVVVVEKKQYEGRDISSTFVREELEAGNIEKANMLLGYPYFFMGKVEGGNHIGRTIGFPTINQLPPDEKLIPPYGVYASHIVIDDKVYEGVTNIGVKPTIAGENRCGIETNIFDFSGDLYGRTLKVRLFSFIRPETKFGGVDELKEQIAKDKEEAKRRLKAYE